MSAKPKAFSEPHFETLLSDYIQHALAYCAERDQDKATLLREAFDNQGELLAQVTQAFVLKRTAEIREQNHQALQMFRKYVTDSDMVDLLALQYSLKRQVIEAGDDTVFPAKPAVMESNESLLQRFDLAPFQFHTTGTRLGYRFHAMTLEERPTITVRSEKDALVMRYEFPDTSLPNPIKDAQARMLEPNTGKVCVALLSRASADGVPHSDLLERAHQYLNRDDIAQESDEVTVKAAIPKPYRIEVTLFTGADPKNEVDNASAVAVAWQFADQAQTLGSIVDREEVAHIFYELGAKRAKVQAPVTDVICAWDEAPYCTEVVVHVRAE
ncbi:baseplate J protein [Vibrio azureus]|uniref:Putative phage baseplate assembly protein n=1 Tax=Vibrio azureus NBRC 104587 TaxID=1219077 RepID=U3A4M3_9VIBR|nr:baseplate J/gp47 family protein [Vibrio azureus]AUI88160.1 baseplate J protein [Vibrio azureus]GAD74946.1 putative phage baseplate assembly protein [Vibrio azureus NBRC 104587]